MSTNQIAGSFVALRGENCNLTTIGGVKSLVTDEGIDLVSIGSKLEHAIVTLEMKVQTLSEKLDKLSNIGDVDLDGLADGAILEWNAQSKKWVVALSESS